MKSKLLIQQMKKKKKKKKKKKNRKFFKKNLDFSQTTDLYKACEVTIPINTFLDKTIHSTHDI